MEPLLDKGYRLYFDNYYCCPELSKKLLERNTMSCRTVRRNRVNMPKDLFVGRQKKGELDYRRNGQLVVTRWTDKREVVTLSTMSLPTLHEVQGRVEIKNKPLAVIDYVINMSGVDHSDQLVSYSPMHRKSLKWWKKPFFHLLTLAMVQSSVLLNIHRRGNGRKQIPVNENIKTILMSLVNGAVEPVTSGAGDGPTMVTDRLEGRHFPSFISGEGSKATRKNCKVCYDRALKAGGDPKQLKSKRQTTPYWCPQCKIPLCVVPCFEYYHSRKDFTV